jgi:sortase A
MSSVRRPLRALSTVLIVAGVLMLTDAALTVFWQEPVSGVYAHYVQNALGDDLTKLERSDPDAGERAALAAPRSGPRRMAFLARRLRATARPGDAVGRIRIPKIDADFVVVAGTDTASLRKGPGIYDGVPFPGAPGTTAIAGHRTTYLAPFRRIDELAKGDEITVEMPYGRFTYEVERQRIVKPTEVSVIDRVAFDQLVLSACHPLYSAKRRIIVFARLIGAQARGAAV